MIAALAIVVLFLACLGAGAVVLHTAGLWRDREAIERGALAFAVGFGVVGWIFFWIGIAGVLKPVVVWAVCLPLVAGNLLHGVRPDSAPAPERLALSTWMLLGLLAVAVIFDALEALAPPVDADSLAYHFNLPRRFLEQGAVTFNPWAFSGAIPLLVQMTYAAALGLGGETALTGWALVSAWMVSVLLFAFTRRWLPLPWALMVAVLFQTLPAMVYGAGSGQVEARLALFVLAAVVGLADGWRTGRLAPAVLVGLGAGFYAASKYTGLLFLLAAGIAILLSGRPWFRRGLLFGLAAALAGSQWYGWNFFHTGDPVFPMLFNLADALGLANHAYWNAGHAADLRSYLAGRGEVVSAGHWWFSYPILATLAPPPQIESGRVGLGPFFLLVAPMAALGAWRNRGRLLQSPLVPVTVLLLAYYLLWMKFGEIPKVRHLLPMIPPLLTCLTVAALAGDQAAVRRPMALAAVLSLAVNFAAHGLFSKAYLAHSFSGKSRETFLTENLVGYPVVPLVNALRDVSRVYVWDRQLQYYIRPPTFFAAPYTQALIDGRDGHVEPHRFYRQLRGQGISHLVMRDIVEKAELKTVYGAMPILASWGCLSLEKSVAYVRYSSRTLKSLWKNKEMLNVWRVASSCAPRPDPGR